MKGGGSRVPLRYFEVLKYFEEVQAAMNIAIIWQSAVGAA